MSTPEQHRPRVVMVIPTYNEAENLAWIVGRLRAVQPTVDVLVVDDGSPDGTGRIADELAAADPQVSVLHRTEKAGLGAAYLHGFAVALERGYDVVGEMDADGSHQPEQLHLLLDALDGADLVIGSRWMPGGSVVNWPWTRRALSRGGNAYARTVLGIPVRDVTAGYRVFRRSTLEAIDLSHVESAGYCFQTDLARRGTPARRGADRVRGAGARRVEDGPGGRHGVPAPDHRLGAGRAAASGARRTLEGASPPALTRRPPVRGTTMRRLLPWWVLALAFVVVPVVEIYLLIQVGQAIGAWWTVLLLIAAGFAGSWLVKREGSRAWRALQQALAEHRMPAKELADGALILIGGTLLLTPGFLSDVVGAFAILPVTRPVARRLLTGMIARRLGAAAGRTGRPGGTPYAGWTSTGPRTRRSPGTDDAVVRGEVVDD